MAAQNTGTAPHRRFAGPRPHPPIWRRGTASDGGQLRRTVLCQSDLASAEILVAVVRQCFPYEYRLLVVTPRTLFPAAAARLRLHGVDSELVAAEELIPGLTSAVASEAGEPKWRSEAAR